MTRMETKFTREMEKTEGVRGYEQSVLQVVDGENP